MFRNKVSSYCLLVIFILSNFSCDGNKQRVVKFYYDNGGIESEIQVTGNRMNGISQYYYPSGKLQLVASYVNHKLDGEAREYFEDGGLKSVKNFKDDELHGWVMDYDESGVIMNRIEYSDGKLVFNVSFYPNGDTLGLHENGRTFIFWETGKVKQALCTNNIEIFGLVKFNADGGILQREGSLNCLTKQDSLLLERQYPGWHDKNDE